jgi:hypothetical protein
MSQRPNRGGWTAPEFLAQLAYGAMPAVDAHKHCRPGVIAKLLRDGSIISAYRQPWIIRQLGFPVGPQPIARIAASALRCYAVAGREFE